MILSRSRLRVGSYAALLVALLLYVVVHSVAEERGIAPGWLAQVLFVVILFATLGGVSETRRQLSGLVGLFLVLLVVDLIAKSSGGRTLLVVSRGVHLVFVAYTVHVILRHVFRQSAVTTDMILGSVCAYLLVGLFFNEAYTLLEVIRPGSFEGVADVRADGGYFSLVTLSTLGYGDTVPVTAVARSLAAIEAVVGQFYIAVIVARLVAAHFSTQRAAADEGR